MIPLQLVAINVINVKYWNNWKLSSYFSGERKRRFLVNILISFAQIENDSDIRECKDDVTTYYLLSNK